jgi:hypothetical protein
VTEVAAPARALPKVRVHAMGDYFPTQGEQQSVYAGLRLFAKVGSRFYLLLDAGYIAAGAKAGSGDDGTAVGAGVELVLPRASLPSVTPFVRAHLNHVSEQKSDLASGTLASNTFTLAAGGHFGRAVDVHVLVGQRYSGGLGVGFGVGIGYGF